MALEHELYNAAARIVVMLCEQAADVSKSTDAMAARWSTTLLRRLLPTAYVPKWLDAKVGEVSSMKRDGRVGAV